MEFTKLNWPPAKRAAMAATTAATRVERTGTFYSFPERKLRRKTLDDYLRYASPHRPIRSSIPVEVTKSKEEAEKARKRVELVSAISIISALGVSVTIIALALQTFSFVREVRGDFDKRLKVLEERLAAPPEAPVIPPPAPRPDLPPPESGQGDRPKVDMKQPERR